MGILGSKTCQQDWHIEFSVDVVFLSKSQFSSILGKAGFG